MIKKLRAQPEHVRHAMVYVGTGVFTAVIFGMWAASLPARLNSETVATEGNSPFSIIGEQVANVGSAIGDKWSIFKSNDMHAIERVDTPNQ